MLLFGIDIRYNWAYYPFHREHNLYGERINDMKYRFETLEDARKFASTKIKQGYIVKQAISVVEMPVPTKCYYVVTVLGDKFGDEVFL